MTTNTTDRADAIFWRAYGAAIKRSVGDITINENTAFYLSTKAQRGPPGGDNISERYTNEGIYQVGNNLLPPDQLFYSPSSKNSYIDQLVTYLAWVDVGGKPSSANITQVTNTAQDMNAASIFRNIQLDKALDDFTKRQQAELTGEQTFAQWVVTGAPAWNAAEQAFQSKVAAYQKAIKNAYGPLADIKLADEAKLNAAQVKVPQSALPGFTIECALGAPPSPREFENAQSSGEPIEPPAPVLRPAYNAPSYIGVVKDAQALVGTNEPPNNSLSFGFSDGKDVKDTDFNQSAQSGSAGFSWFPWISFNVKASNEEQRSSVSTFADASDITITMTYDEMTLVTINPSGSWDLGDVRAKYKKLLPKAPKTVQTLVKPTQLLLATRLGYKIKLGAKSSKSFDTAFKQTTTGGGGIRIFGIPCGVRAGATTTKTTNTHNLEWNATKQEIVVKPTENAGFATIVGLIGEKIRTTA